MPDITATPGPPSHDPYEALRRVIVHAINAAFVEGYTVVTAAEYGVYCVSSHARNRWNKDPRAIGPNPIGCVLLELQPRSTEPDKAAIEALGVSAAWLNGFAAGVSKVPPDLAETQKPSRHMYHGGWVLGAEVRGLMTRPRRVAGV